MATNCTPRARRALIAVGLITLIGMLVAAAFALGVYVGEHGWTRAGLRYQPSGGAPPQGPLPGAQQPPGNSPLPEGGVQPQGLPPGRPQVIGKILEIAPQALTLATQDGPRRVMLTPETRYQDEAGAPISLEDLQRGQAVAVFGRFVQDGGRQFQAELVVELPPR
ncbi:MAG: hypothetical protein JXA78_18585 [Anaerolineales bacterium]|nr:hypothetical protein [Anaerolineales bacterium]